MSHELTLVRSEMFGSVSCDIYKKDKDIFMTRKQIGQALGYTDPQKSIDRLHDRHKERLDMFSTAVTLRGMENSGRLYETTLYSAKGVYEICRWSKQEKANDFMDWVWELLEEVRKSSIEEQQNQTLLQMQSRMERIESFIDKRCKAQVNPRYIYNYCWNDYARATGDDSKRGLNGALNDYFGYVPYSKDIRPLPVKDWVCKHIGAEAVEDFVNSVDDGLIVKSKEGHWVNKGGFGCNNYEWSKVLDEFKHRCAYCNISEDETNLMPEHIISQSVLSEEDPRAVDLIGNIVPACGCCNGSKNTSDMETWFRKQPFFSEYRLQKIQRHIKKYEL